MVTPNKPREENPDQDEYGVMNDKMMSLPQFRGHVGEYAPELRLSEYSSPGNYGAVSQELYPSMLNFQHAMNGMRQPMSEDRYVQLPASQTDINNHYNTTEGNRGTNSQQSSTTTNTIHVEQYITSSDPQTAGDAAARGIGEVLNEQANVTTDSNGRW